MHFLMPEIPIAEKIIRPVVVYLFLLIAFRLAGKRELGQMTPFDLIVLLTISNVLQNAMIGADNSLGGGLIGALTLFVLNGVLARVTFHFPWLARVLEGSPTPLIEKGKIIQPSLRREVMTIEELHRALRKHDLDWEDIPRIDRALLELDGTVTVHLKEAQTRSPENT
jgi:uncharacterized membrane protein YcaP (DUF421 family)